jgi:hypothetical protein
MNEYQLNLDLALTFEADSDDDARSTALEIIDQKIPEFDMFVLQHNNISALDVKNISVITKDGMAKTVPLEVTKLDYMEKMCLRVLSRAVSRMLKDRDFYYAEIAYVIRAHIDPSINAGKCTPIINIVHMPSTMPGIPERAGKPEYTGDRHSFLDLVGHIELSIVEGRPFMDIINDIANDVRIIMTDGDYTKLTSADMYSTWCARIAI